MFYSLQANENYEKINNSNSQIKIEENINNLNHLLLDFKIFIL